MQSSPPRRSDKAKRKRKGDEDDEGSEGDDEPDEFKMKELKAQVFDTYAICAALLTALSSTRFFFDNRNAVEIITVKGGRSTLHLSFVLQHIHVLFAAICTASGLEAMLVFVLCTMYARLALAKREVGQRVFDHFLEQTQAERQRAFSFMINSGLLASFNLVIQCLSFPPFIMQMQVPCYVQDVASLVCAVLVFVIFAVTLYETWFVMKEARVIFLPKEEVLQVLGEEERLTMGRKQTDYA